MKMYEIRPSGHSWAAEPRGHSHWMTRRKAGRKRACLNLNARGRSVARDRVVAPRDGVMTPREGMMMVLRSFLGRKEVFLVLVFLFLPCGGLMNEGPDSPLPDVQVQPNLVLQHPP